MRCHDILGIKENATLIEIEEAYSRKTKNLDKSKDVLLPGSLEIKLKELLNAKNECVAWIDKSAVDRIKGRAAESMQSRTSDIRLNEICFGPCTFTDICCGACTDALGCDCCCPEIEVSCCYTVCGSQAVPVIADIGIYAWIIWAAYKDKKEKQEKQEREYRIQQANRAREDNAIINSQLTQCLAEQAKCADQVRAEEEKVLFVESFMAMFTKFGTTNGQAVVTKQKEELGKTQTALSDCRKKETELRNRIKENQRIIDAGN